MPISWNFEDEHLVVFRVSGHLGKAELDEAQKGVEPGVRKSGSAKFLVLLENFAGWAQADGWEDTSFADRNDDNIERMAVVADEEWRDQMFAFTLKGLRPVEIEFFVTGQEAAARAWLTQ